MNPAHEIVTRAVQLTLDRWRGHKSFAWSGECGIFADYAFHQCRDLGVEPAIHDFDDSLDTQCAFIAPEGVTMAQLVEWGVSINHVWLTYQDRFYDASCPSGTDSLLELPSIQLGLYYSLGEQKPEVLHQLVSSHPWWAARAIQAEAFDRIYAERDALYEEN